MSWPLARMRHPMLSAARIAAPTGPDTFKDLLFVMFAFLLMRVSILMNLIRLGLDLRSRRRVSIKVRAESAHHGSTDVGLKRMPKTASMHRIFRL